MALYGYDGYMGSGKSFGMYQHAFAIAERDKKHVIVTNQPKSHPLNLDALMEYAIQRRWKHLYKLARYQAVVYAYDLGELLAYRNSVCVIDEAAIFLNTRDWQHIAKQAPDLISDLVQVRKTAKDIIWAAQAFDMVDKQVRQLTHLYWVCNSLGPWYVRHIMKMAGLEKFRQGHKLMRCIAGFPEIGKFDGRIFKIYDTNATFDELDARQRTFTPTLDRPGWSVRETAGDYYSGPFVDPSWTPDWLATPGLIKKPEPVSSRPDAPRVTFYKGMFQA